MKALLLLFTFALSSHPALASSCELTDKGRSVFRELSLEGCEYDFCVRYVKKSGRSGLERLRPSGCGESNCWSSSPGFTHVFPSSTGVGTHYLGDRTGKEVFLICSYPR